MFNPIYPPKSAVLDYWRFTSLEFFFVRLRLALNGTAHNNNFLVVDDKRGGGIDPRQSLRPLSTIRNSTFPLIIVRLSLRSYLCSACSISLFTGTCLGCFATVALAEIRNSVFFTILIYVNIP